MSIYQRFGGEKCKQFSWIGFPSKPEPQEAVKIELGEAGRVGVEGWRVTPALFQAVQQKLAGSAWLNPTHCEVRTMQESILRLGSMQCIDYVLKFSPHFAFDEKSLKINLLFVLFKCKLFRAACAKMIF